MSTTATTATGAPAQDVARPAERPVPARTPFPRVLRVELRKMFNTRSGFWLMASIGILAVLATTATIAFIDADDLRYEDFASAVGFPMAVILPIVAILAVSSEWSQRTALTTFTLVPSRGRVLAAKLVLTVVIGAVSMLLAAAIGALGNVVACAIAGVDPTWDVGAEALGRIVLANEIGMLVGFMLGVVLRSSPAAIVGYFVYSLVLPGASTALAMTQDWWNDNAAWFDHSWATSRLFEEAAMSGQDWAQLGVTTLAWLVVPLALGTRALLRSEVK
ncbi:ABC transporter permease subunit [Nocardioides sp. zg-ZUI104]|uniref:ABC transporter permease subunit n=1 Tax=Nocardioides faecalis TaxID=2803858 RepID=UPI001BCD19E9|nr:ABC transporter permease subunit [Nocardioides faecalis]MBS4751483.1 ABC transporter permease subunit [Nocardioides faecalis]